MLEEVLTKQETNLLKAMTKDYSDSYQEIKHEYEQYDWQYDDEGELKNTDDLKEFKKNMAIIIGSLWLTNGKNITKTSADTIGTTRLFYDFMDKQIDTRINTKLNLSHIISEQIRERNEKIQFKSIIGGNIKGTTQRMYSVVAQGVKGQKTPRQVEKSIKKILSNNGGKATTIATTEVNTHKSLAKQSAGKLSETRGNLMKKTWIYNWIAAEPRMDHASIDGEQVFGVGSYFSIGTDAPQNFGDPAQDINCHCSHIVEYTTPIDFDTDEYKEFIKNY